MSRTDPTEAESLRVITDWLEIQQAQRKLVYIRHNPSNVVGKKGEATFRKVRQSQLGVADLIVVQSWPQYAGFSPQIHLFFIEVKSSTGKQSDAQKKFQQLVEAQDCRYIVARSLEDVMEELK